MIMHDVPIIPIGIMQAVGVERDRQMRKWGSQFHSPAVWIAILAEEFGELAKEMNELEFRDGDLTAMRREAIQVATVALCIASADVTP